MLPLFLNPTPGPAIFSKLRALDSGLRTATATVLILICSYFLFLLGPGQRYVLDKARARLMGRGYLGFWFLFLCFFYLFPPVSPAGICEKWWWWWWFTSFFSCSCVELSKWDVSLFFFSLLGYVILSYIGHVVCVS